MLQPCLSTWKQASLFPWDGFLSSPFAITGYLNQTKTFPMLWLKHPTLATCHELRCFVEGILILLARNHSWRCDFKLQGLFFNELCNSYWSQALCFYFVFTVFSTVGFGDIVADNTSERVIESPSLPSSNCMKTGGQLAVKMRTQ